MIKLLSTNAVPQKKLLNDIFKFPEGLYLPCLIRKAVPQCCAAMGKTSLIIVRSRQWNF